MKAARLYEVGDLRIENVPEPSIGRDEVLVRTATAFVCGTDVRMYKNGKAGIHPDNPRVLGHELAGTIEQVGSEVQGYSVGMRVAVAPNYGCGVCDRCVAGNTQLCSRQKAIGIAVDGAFAEYVRIPAPAVRQGNIYILPETISFHSAALVEPFSCVYNAYERIGIYPGERVLIIGAGPIGVMHAKLADLAGAGSIYMNDLSEGRLNLAKGIVPAIEALHTEDLKAEIDGLTGGDGVDLVITAASVAAIQEIAFSLAGMNGRVMFFGGLPKSNSHVWLDTNEIHYKQLIVSGTTMQSLHQYREILRLMERGVLTADDIVTGTVGVEDTESVIEQITDGSGLKTAIAFE